MGRRNLKVVTQVDRKNEIIQGFKGPFDLKIFIKTFDRQ